MYAFLFKRSSENMKCLILVLAKNITDCYNFETKNKIQIGSLELKKEHKANNNDIINIYTFERINLYAPNKSVTRPNISHLQIPHSLETEYE